MNNNSESYHATSSFLIVLDSQNATTYYNDSSLSDIHFALRDPIIVPTNCLLMSWTVYSFTCPISFYLINSSNNLLSITVGGITNIYSIPYGNYNVNSFTTTLLNILPAGYTLTMNSIDNKFTLGYTSDFTINSTSTIYKVMGFSANTSYSSTSKSLTFPFTCNFAGITSFNIYCENIKTKNLDSFDGCSASSIIANIPINGGSNGMIYYEKRNDYNFEVKEKTINELEISIMDSQENYINFNNQNWSLVIQVNMMLDMKKQYNETFQTILQNGYYKNN